VLFKADIRCVLVVSVVGFEAALEGNWLAEKDKHDLIVAFLRNVDIVSRVHSCASRRLFLVFSSDVRLLKDSASAASCLDYGVRHDWSPTLAHHEGHVRELVLNLAVREADAGDELVRDVD